ncbi:MAG: M1 family aminopeptidase [Planctomycetota bacterium]
MRPLDSSAGTRRRRPARRRLSLGLAALTFGLSSLGTVLVGRLWRRGTAVEDWPRVEHLDLDLDCSRPPSLSGRAKLRLSGVSTPRVALMLNRDLGVDAARVDGQARHWTTAASLRARHHREGRPLFVDLPQVPPSGRVTLELTYSGRGRDGTGDTDWRGILLVADDELRMSEQTIFYPQVPLAVDSPAACASTARVRVRAAADLEVFVPGTPHGCARDGDTRTWDFELERPGTLAVLATRGHRREIVREGARVVTLLSADNEALAEPFAETSIRVLDTFRTWFGPAAGSSLGIVEFRGRGASYNWAQQGVIAFERGALGGRKVPVAKLAHEIAHLWWGQAVPGQGRGERFLTESLAEYSAWRFMAHAEGVEQARALAQAARTDWLRSVHEHGSDAALADVEFSTPGYRALAYAKGPLVLRRAEAQLGTDAMIRALAAYARNAAGAESGTTGIDERADGGRGTLASLQAALAAEANGLELPWLEHAGHAHLVVTEITFDRVQHTLQGRLQGRPCPAGIVELPPHGVDLDLRAPGLRQRAHVTLDDGQRFALSVPVAPEWIGIDPADCLMLAECTPWRGGGAKLVQSEPAASARDVVLGPFVARLRFDRRLAPLPNDAARELQDANRAAARSRGLGLLAVRDARLGDDSRVLELQVDGTHPATEYELVLPSCLEDEHGVPLPPVSLRFETASADGLVPPRVVATHPEIGAEAVSRDLAAIRIEFSVPMRASSGFKTRDVRAQADLGRTYPPIEFGEWLDDHTIEFRIRMPLEPATAYALPVGENFEDRRGIDCQPVALHFRTAPR